MFRNRIFIHLSFVMAILGIWLIAASFSFGLISKSLLYWHWLAGIILIWLGIGRKTVIPGGVQKSEFGQGGSLSLSQAQPSPKQPNLNKLGDAGELKGRDFSDAAQNRFLNHEMNTLKQISLFFPQKGGF